MSDEAWRRWQSGEIERLRQELRRVRTRLYDERQRAELWRLRAMGRPRPWRFRGRS